MKNEKQSGSLKIVAALMVILVVLIGVLTVNVLQIKKFADSGTT